jgi:hypothetical protein
VDGGEIKFVDNMANESIDTFDLEAFEAQGNNLDLNIMELLE